MKLITEVQQGMFSLPSVTDLSATDSSPASLLPFPVYLAAVISQALSKRQPLGATRASLPC